MYTNAERSLKNMTNNNEYEQLTDAQRRIIDSIPKMSEEDVPYNLLKGLEKSKSLTREDVLSDSFLETCRDQSITRTDTEEYRETEGT